MAKTLLKRTTTTTTTTEIFDAVDSDATHLVGLNDDTDIESNEDELPEDEAEECEGDEDAEGEEDEEADEDVDSEDNPVEPVKKPRASKAAKTK